MLKEERKLQKRYVAHKVKIKDILDSRYNKVEGFDSNYLDLSGKEISRVNVVGVVVQKVDAGNRGSIVIEDGTGQISVRSFESNNFLKNTAIGDVVLLIGKPREFSGEKYILVEIVKKIDGGWAKVRKAELNKNPENNAESEKTYNHFKEVYDSPKNRVLKVIKEKDKGDGVAVEELGISDIDEILALLLKEGDVFEVRPGRLKILE